MLRELLFLQVSSLNKVFCAVTKSDSQLFSSGLAGVAMWITGVGPAFYLDILLLGGERDFQEEEFC